MIKQLASDFSALFDPDYQPMTFQPYLSMILSITFITVVGFSIQTMTTTLYTYAAHPVALETELKQQIQTCSDFQGKFYLYLCEGLKQPVEENTAIYTDFLQDLHNPIN